MSIILNHVMKIIGTLCGSLLEKTPSALVKQKDVLSHNEQLAV